MTFVAGHRGHTNALIGEALGIVTGIQDVNKAQMAVSLSDAAATPGSTGMHESNIDNLWAYSLSRSDGSPAAARATHLLKFPLGFRQLGTHLLLQLYQLLV